ncbi:Protein of unknown function [Citrobacter amalonaticus]|nr:Protein of unknown function [Citrobacter amalonaticus]
MSEIKTPVAWLLTDPEFGHKVATHAEYTLNFYRAKGWKVTPLQIAQPTSIALDTNGFLPCPFCNSPVKWCGENGVDPDDNHVCHHIQCTNHECGADFDFINTGDDLLPDDPETLDAMTAAECLQPLRNVCLSRFNSRAALLQGKAQSAKLLPGIKPAQELDSATKKAESQPGNYQLILDCWVACSERMPSKGQRVLAFVDFDSSKVTPLVKDAEYTGSTFRIGPNTVNAEGEPRVTHWMPLPAAPQQEVKNGNDVTTGKPLTITLPDITSKVFWSGTRKSETFHPETYKRWVKEAIERACVIARIGVEVK